MSWKRKALYSFAVLVAFILAAEVGLRLAGYGRYVLFQPDDELLFVPRPNQRGLTVVGHQVETINDRSLRYPENVPARAADEIRIVTLGDSVTMGWGMDDQSTYSGVLEQMLADHDLGRRARVLNAGVNAYPTTLCVRRFERLLCEGEQIDLAIFAFSFNIGHEVLPLLTGEEKEQFLRNVRLKSLVRRSAIYNLVIEGLLREAVYYRIREHLIAGSWETEETEGTGEEPAPDAPSSWASHLPEYRRSLERMVEHARTHEVPLVFLLLGSEEQRGDLNIYQQAFHEHAIASGIAVVDMIEANRDRDHAPLFIDATHPSAFGQRLIAQQLEPVVLRILEPRANPVGASPEGSSLGPPVS